ncbi:fatty acyl-CoA reductase 3 [Dorcoceras hygrometricum]|uniref:Fatty acyl-CoA reductase n=1 Tax=Dorcoceras hygrometricum TaxID=472368 RepID=A0A2Z7CTS5_9LAMI|nr:fatty acyl-CoA reductase 3 [Dorcoceras hygrometricum]
MDESEIFKHFEGKTILITGATGFLAKIFLEKTLRVQPNVKKLFLLIRPTTERSVERRLHEEILGLDLFRVLREGMGDDWSSLVEKVIPVPGDISVDNLGILDSVLRHNMLQEIDIIVNSAATTTFDERYDVALGINALGAMHVEKFARGCSKLETLLHVSTAYVHGNAVGLTPERAFRKGETLDGAKISYLDINMETKIAQERLRELQTQNATEKEITRAMKDLGIERSMLHGWPNTYVFTKAMGEMILENFNEEANLIIVRPTIITSTISEPFCGWIEGLRTLDSIFVAYGKGKLKFFAGDPESTLDMIPGDMVVNCMMAAIAVAASSSSDSDESRLSIYHIGSSNCNPLKFGELKWLMHRFLIENPLLDDKGKPIKVGQPTTLNTMASFHRYIATHYLPFVKALQLGNIIFCKSFESAYTTTRRRISQVMRLAELYKPYIFFQGIFDDSNTKNLRKSIRSSQTNMNLLNFDPTHIQWDEYFLKTHFVGIGKYALK